MDHNVDRRQKTNYWYFDDVNKILNYLLLQTVLNAIRRPACLAILAVSHITMVILVTLRVVFLHKGNPHGTSHVQKHGNTLHKRNLWINRSGHDSIGNNLGDGGIPHDDSNQTGMQNMDDGTMSSCSTVVLLVPPNIGGAYQKFQNYISSFYFSSSLFFSKLH